MKLIIYTDGGSRGNPGPGGLGVVIYNTKGKILKTCSRFLKLCTNNQAEYKALILGLEKAKTFKATSIDCYLDSELIVKQLNREYKVKDPILGSLFISVWNLSQFFKSVNFYHISRTKNTLADSLVNEALNKKLK